MADCFFKNFQINLCQKDDVKNSKKREGKVNGGDQSRERHAPALEAYTIIGGT